MKIKTIKISFDTISQVTHKKVSAKYAHLSSAERAEIAFEYGFELYVEEMNYRMKKDEIEVAYMQVINEKTGETITKQKVYKQNDRLFFDAEYLKKSLNVSSDDKTLTNIASTNQRLKPEEYFVHPLTELMPDNPKYVNMYGLAQVLINGVRNSHDLFPEDREKCEETLRRLLVKINPILNINKTIADIKMHKLTEIMNVSNAIANADWAELGDAKGEV